MRYWVLVFIAAFLPVSSLAQEKKETSAIDRTIAARLTVSEFIRICVRTDADPDLIEEMSLKETWLPAAPSSLAIGLNRSPTSAVKVYTFTRSRSTSAGRVRNDVRIIVPEPGVQDCTMEFEAQAFGDIKRGLVASGYSVEKDITVPADAPVRVKRAKMCEVDKPRRDEDCVELAVDPAQFPLIGQLTYLRGGEPDRPRPVFDGPGTKAQPKSVDPLSVTN